MLISTSWLPEGINIYSANFETFARRIDKFSKKIKTRTFAITTGTQKMNQYTMTTMNDLHRMINNTYREILTKVLAAETETFGRTAYVNSGSLSRKLGNQSMRHKFNNTISMYILDQLADTGELSKHTFARGKSNRHYYSLSNVIRPEEEPKKGVNLI